MKFSTLPAGDRWTALDRELPALIASHVKAADIDPSDEVSIAELAEKHGIGERAMANRLRDLGGIPYQLGKSYFIRRKSLVIALDTAEREAAQPTTGGDGR